MAYSSCSSLCSSARQSIFLQGLCPDAEFSFGAKIYRTKVAKTLYERSNALSVHGAVRTSSCFLPIVVARCHASGNSQSSVERPSEQLDEAGHGSNEGATQKVDIDNCLSNEVNITDTCGNDGNGCGNENGNGKFGGGGGDDDGGENGDENDDRSVEEDDDFGSVLNSEEASKRLEARGVSLPSDMAEAVKAVGIRSLILERFMDLQGARWPLGAIFRTSPMFRDRMLADQSFLFKLLAEIAIDSCCATFAEVQKRGKEFWNEFELYMADLIVGLVVCTALVGMLAPVVRFKTVIPSTGLMSQFAQTIESLPSSVFEAATQGRQFSLQQRVASFFYKSIQYGAVGFGCGIVGQGIANSIMHIKRKVKQSEEDVPIPPLFKSAALWGVFLAISANTRYQIVNGLERVVEGSIVAKRIPLVAMAFTVGIRFGNNVYGGMQFVDWARWSGVQ